MTKTNLEVRRLHFSNVIGMKDGEFVTNGSSKRSNLLETINFKFPEDKGHYDCPWIRFGFWIYGCEALTDSLIELGRIKLWFSLKKAFKRWRKKYKKN